MPDTSQPQDEALEQRVAHEVSSLLFMGPDRSALDVARAVIPLVAKAQRGAIASSPEMREWPGDPTNMIRSLPLISEEGATRGD